MKNQSEGRVDRWVEGKVWVAGGRTYKNAWSHETISPFLPSQWDILHGHEQNNVENWGMPLGS